MARTSCVISFGLFDTTARADGVLGVTDKQTWVDLGQLHTNGEMKKWGTLEHNGFLLDGTHLLFPENPAAERMGLWSSGITGENCKFAVASVLTVTFSEPHTSMGITLDFSNSTKDWCDDLSIIWYNSAGAVMSNKAFTPNKGEYFCQNQIENYYKIVITFRGTNKPYRHLKLNSINYGLRQDFGDGDLVSASLLEQVDPISNEVSVNTLNFRAYDAGLFDLLNPTGTFVLFQQKQEMRVKEFVDGINIDMGTFYLDAPSSNNDGTTTYDCEDLLGVIDKTEYMGNIWLTGVTVASAVKHIMTSAKEASGYVIDSSLASLIITGYIPICTHREALQQVAFAIGAMVDCSRSDKIKIIPMLKTVSGTIGLDRKVIGHTLQQTDLITSVEVYEHKYRLDTWDEVELFKDNCKVGEQTVKLNSPSSNFSITGATILESGVNHVKLNVSTAGGVILKGYAYKDDVALKGVASMGVLPANTKANIVTIDSCTISCDSQALAQRIYDYYQYRISEKGQLMPGVETVGDRVRITNSEGNALEGVIVSMSTDLTNGFLHDAEVIGKAVI